MAARTKDATQKLDKLQQSSRDIITDTTRSASSRLLSAGKSLQQSSLDRLKSTKRTIQNVRQTIGMSIVGANQMTPGATSNEPNDHDLNRWHSEHKVFESIAFESNLKSKETSNSYAPSAEASYEVPRSYAMAGDLESPPSYRELYRTLPDDTNRNAALTQSVDFSGYRKTANIPFPNFPAPILPLEQEEPFDRTAASNYTQMSPVVRNNRSKDYEDTQIRFKSKPPADDVPSNRATVDSQEYMQLNASLDRLDSCFSRSIISADFSKAEQNLPSPSRSESWAFYDTAATTTSTAATQHDDADSGSSPEPIYENNHTATVVVAESEPIYGAVYTMHESPGGTLLAPVAVPRQKRKSASSPKVESKTNEILKEFDPMDWSAVDQMFSSKSNELILLESLLAEDTYGTLATVNSDELSDTEDDDEPSAGSTDLPASQSDSLKVATNTAAAATKPAEELRKSVIVHQNLKLHAFDLIDEDAAVAPFLAKCEPKGTAEPNTNWFVECATQPPATTPSGIAPPPYVEILPEVLPADERRSKFTSIFTNVFTKRKPSFKSPPRAATDLKIYSRETALSPMQCRPQLTQRLTLHEGTIIRLPSKAVDDILKEQHRAMAFIRDRRFQVYTDKEMKCAKETIPLEHIVAIQCVSQHKFTNNSVELHCFEVTTVAPKNGEAAGSIATTSTATISPDKVKPDKLIRTTHLYGVAKESDRFIWMQKLFEGLTDLLPTAHTCRYYRAGWCFLKNSITSQWSAAWIVLHKHKKRLVCYAANGLNADVLDLRKARCLILKESDDSVALLPVENGPLLMVDCPPYSMYMVMCSARETKVHIGPGEL